MKCREFQRSIDGASITSEGRAHLAACGHCRDQWALVTLRRAVLQASRWAEPIAEPDSSFFYALGRRLRQGASAAERSVWLPTIRLARSFVAVAATILIILTGLNLYLARHLADPIVRLDSYWRDASGDGEALVLSDEALTHEQVLDSLVTMRETNEKRR